MSHELLVELEPVEGALLRILGTVERRGFGVRAITSARTDDCRQSLRLELDGDRDPLVLCRQLERLVDVLQVRLMPEPADPAQQPSAQEGFQATWLQ